MRNLIKLLVFSQLLADFFKITDNFWEAKAMMRIGTIIGTVLFVVLVAGLAFALEEGAAPAVAAGSSDTAKAALAIAAGFGLGIAAAIGTLGQGRAVAAAMEGISRNPAAADKMFLPLILGLVFMESLVIYMLVVAFFLQGKI